MFGYVRPLTAELKVREYELFKASYCTLCHTLRQHFGFPAGLVLNFDFTFLAMLLSENEPVCSVCGKRCIVSPVKKKNVIENPPESFYRSAGYSVILAYWKLMDEINDERGFKRLKARALALLLRRSYKRAAKAFPAFDKTVREKLRELSDLEKSREASIDRAADKFALILAAVSENADEKKSRILYELLYQTGRWIYIIDAYNDIQSDLNDGSYNPIVEKYALKTLEDFTDEMKNSVKLTISHSLGRIGSAYELMGDTLWSGIIRNIIYLGMDDVFGKVSSGEYIPEENIR